MATARESMELLQTTARNVGRTMRRMGAIMTTMGAVGAAGIGILVNEANRIDRAFREINTLLSKGENAQRQFADASERISEQFAVQGGQLQVIKGLYQSISAGITDAGEATNFMEDAARLATVGLTDMETTIDVLTTAINAYSLETSESERVSNLFFGTVQKGKVRLEELARALPPLISFSAQFGVSLEEISAGMALMTKQGFSARRASRALRSTIRKFMKPSEDMITVLKELAGSEIELTEAGRRAREEYQRQQNALNELKRSHSDVKTEIENLNSRIRSNKAQIRELQTVTGEERQEIVQLRFDIEEATRALRGMGEEMDGLTDSMRENRIKIKEIRLQARKEGRELTEEEKKQIEELQVANEELSLQQLKLEDQMDSVRDKRREAKNEIEKKNQLTEEEFKQVQKLKQENESLSNQVEELRRKESDLSDQITAQRDKVESAEKNWNSYAKQLGSTLLEQKGLGESLKLVAGAAEELNLPLGDVINSQRALQAVFPILNNDMENYNELLGFMRDGGADVADIFENRVEPTLDRKLRSTLNDLRNTLATIGSQFKKDIIPIVQRVTGAVERLSTWWGNLDQETRKAISQFTIMASVISLVVGPALLLVGTLVSLVAVLGTGGLIAVAGAASVAMAGLTAAFNDIKSGGDQVEQTIQKLTDLFNKLREAAKKAWNIFKEELLPSFINLGDAIAGVVREMARLVKETVNFGDAQGSIRKYADTLGNAINRVAEFIRENETLIAKVGLVVGALVGFGATAITIINTLSKLRIAFAALSGKLSIIIGPIGSIVAKFATLAKTFVNAGLMTTLMKTRLGTLIAKIMTLFNVVGMSGSRLAILTNMFPRLALVAGKFTTALGLLKTAVVGAASVLTGPLVVGIAAVAAAIAAYATNFGGFRDAINQAFLDIKNIIVGVLSFVWYNFTKPLLNDFMKLWKTHFGNIEIVTIDVMGAINKAIRGLEPVIRGIIDVLQYFRGIALGFWSKWGNEIKVAAKFIMDVLRTYIITAFDALFTAMRTFWNIVNGDFSAAWDIMVNFIKRTTSRISTIIDKWNIKKKVMTIFKTLFNNLSSFIISTVPGILTGALLSLLDLLLQPFKDLYNEIIGSSIIPDLFKDIANFIKNKAVTLVVNAIVSFFTSYFNFWKTNINNIYTFFETKTKEWVSWVKKTYQNIRSWLEKTMKKMYNKLQQLLKKWVTNFKNRIKKWDSWVRDKFKKLKKNVQATFRKLWRDLKRKLNQWVKNFKETIRNWATTIKKRINNFRTELVNTFKRLWNRTKQLLQTWVTNFRNEINQWKNRVEQKVNTFKNNLVTTFKNLFTNIKTELTNFITLATNRITQWITNIEQKITTFSNNLTITFKNLFLDIKQRLQSWITTFKNKVTLWKTNIEGKLTTLKENAISTFKNLFSDIKTKLNNWKKTFETKIDNLIDNVLKAFRDFANMLFYNSIIKDLFSDITSHIEGIDFAGAISGPLEGLTGMVEDAMGAVETAFSNASDEVSGLEESIKTSASEAFDTVKTKIGDAKEKIENFDPDIPSASDYLPDNEDDGDSGDSGDDGSSDSDDDDGGDDGGNVSAGSGEDSTGGTRPGSSVPNNLGPGGPDSGDDQGTGPVNETEGGGTIPGFDRGGFVNAGSGMPAMLHGKEAIMPLPDLRDLIRTVGGMNIVNDMSTNLSTGAATTEQPVKSTEVSINEGAVKIEPGAFQGVSDEELPNKVGDEVDERMREILDDIRGTGN